MFDRRPLIKNLLTQRGIEEENQRLITLRTKTKTTLHPSKMQVLWNSIQKARECDRLVNKKPPNLMWDQGGKPTSQKKVTVLRALAVPPEIDCQRRSIDKKPPNPNRKQGRKTKRLGLGFFSNNPKLALLL